MYSRTFVSTLGEQLQFVGVRACVARVERSTLAFIASRTGGLGLRPVSSRGGVVVVLPNLSEQRGECRFSLGPFLGQYRPLTPFFVFAVTLRWCRTPWLASVTAGPAALSAHVAPGRCQPGRPVVSSPLPTPVDQPLDLRIHCRWPVMLPSWGVRAGLRLLRSSYPAAEAGRLLSARRATVGVSSSSCLGPSCRGGPSVCRCETCFLQ